jgi:alpha-1,2-mannosyltransferase
LYGVEPWHYYLANLTLNFNIVFPFALLAPLACVWTWSDKTKQQGRGSRLATILATLGWIAFMSTQPHKEERFMYVIYVFLVIAAA